MIIWFDAPGCADVAIAGGKGASLGLMTRLGMPVPRGFVVSAGALEQALAASGTLGELREVPAGGDSVRLGALVRRARVPEDLAHAIGDAYRELGDDVPVAVRSSATAEDSRIASFAGQHETYLNVRGADRVLQRVRDCWGSLFSERALAYRRNRALLDHLGMAVVVQRMVEPDVSGVMFTIDPTSNRRDRMVVEAVFGLGAAVVSGRVTPDHYVLCRDGRLKRVRLGEQPYALTGDPAGGVRDQMLAPERGGAQKLREEQLHRLAQLGRDLEARLGGPQDVEWVIRGDELYLLQSRPVTTYGQPNPA